MKFLRTARLIPEETVSRPVLPLRPYLPGLFGADMRKLSYGEQLKHPGWQRVRLERLEAAGWKCQACGDKETTLHVHHKQYIKGRMAWEYPAENFEVLCEGCHAQAHKIREDTDAILAWAGPWRMQAALPLLVGWLAMPISTEIARKHWEEDEERAAAGLVARLLECGEYIGVHPLRLNAALCDHQFRRDLCAAVEAYEGRAAESAGAADANASTPSTRTP